MTKKFKRALITLIVSVCMLFCLCVVVACNPTDDSSANYTITVKKDASTPAEGVKVQIKKGNATIGKAQTTDKDGKVEFKLPPDSYDVKLSYLPEGYHLEKDTLTLTANKKDITVTLEKDFVYVVKLVDEQGEPYYAEGVEVMICTLTGNCLPGVELSENGIAEIAPVEGVYDYHVKVNYLPENYSVGNVDAEGYYAGQNFSAEVTEMTITVYNITSITDLTPMSDVEKAVYAQSNAYYKENGQQFVSYLIERSLEVDEIAYFSLDASISGRFVFYKTNNVTYLTNGTEFVASGEGNGLYETLTCSEGKTYYFKAVNNNSTKVNVKFVVTAPYSSYVDQTGKGADLSLKVGKANTNAILCFTPTEAGTYSVEVKCADKTALKVFSKEPNELLESPHADSDYATNPSTTFVAYTSSLSAGCYITVTAKTPAELSVTIKKTAPANDTLTVVEVEEQLSQFGKPENQELVGVPLDGTAQLVYSSADRYYHYKTANGPVVVVKLTQSLETGRFSERHTLAYMEMTTKGQVRYQFVTLKPNGEDVADYRIFLRGFVDYEEGETGMLGTELVKPDPETIEVENYYAKYVNDDGVYPLTEELKIFLEKFYTANKSLVDYNTQASEGNAWMFPCYYYADTTEADALVGTYKFVSLTEGQNVYNVGDAYAGYVTAVQNGLTEGKLTADTCVIKINKDNSFVILPYNSENQAYNENDTYDNGRWTKGDNGEYSFTCEGATLTYNNGVFTYVKGDVTLVFGSNANA